MESVREDIGDIMKLSISNIAWDKSFDIEMYQFLENNQIDGIEIAPTRIFEGKPYDRLNEAKDFSRTLKEKYNLSISSMQSIWYGREEKVFGSKEERKRLVEYTKKAFEFANVIGCKNLVFGCPKNRNIDGTDDIQNIEIDFFGTLADIAKENNTVLAIEANPKIYNTNYINYTKQAFELVNKISKVGIAVNLDVGTILQNGEQYIVSEINVDAINHVHFSRPFLEFVEMEDFDKVVINKLNSDKYNKYVSIEMKNCNDIKRVKNTVIDFKKLMEINK